MRTKAKTHAARGSGARMAELRGADLADIRRAGRWANGALENCYLTQMPRQTMRVLAGFKEERGCFFLKRASIDPAEPLQQQLFPQIDSLLHYHEGKDGNIAAIGFLRLLKCLRIIFLQDSVVLKSTFPNHPIWRHEIFESDSYKIFHDSLTSSINTTEDPSIDKLKQIAPALSSKLDQIINNQSITANVVTEMHNTQAEVKKRSFNLRGYGEW